MLCFCSCNRLHEAQSVVAEADNLRNSGIMYDDSTRLAAAVATLKPMRLFHPTDYAKANYYYGRLLRNRENYVAAMQCFIDATESNTDDKELLGRVYSNIATLCSFEENNQLAYQIYEKSSKCFYEAKNLSAYYYALNDMAFMSVLLQEKQNAMSLLQRIANENTDSSVQVKTYETYSEYYIFTQQYDSTIYYVNLLHQAGYNESTGLINKAKAYYNTNRNDSALYYANNVISTSNSEGDNYNMLYIIIHADTTLTQTERDSLISKRYDIGLKLKNDQGQLSHSVEILEQYNKRKNLLLRIKISIISLGILCLLILLLRMNIIRRHLNKLKASRQKLVAINNQVIEQGEKLDNLKIEYESVSIKNDSQKREIIKSIEENVAMLRKTNDLKKILYWKDYNKFCQIINSRFYNLITKLQQNLNLTQEDIKLCVLILLNMSYKDISIMMNLSEKSVGQTKNRTAKKLGVKGGELRNYLIELICQ